MRIIDADALKRHEQKIATEAWKMKIKASVETILNQFIDDIDHAPTVDAVPVVHGRWINETFKAWGLVHHPYKCDQCGYHSEAPSDYCPDCGAKMDGKDGNDNG